MPSAVTAAASSRRSAGISVAQEREILRNGTAEQRRRLLRMRLLPLPDDIEAVAVPGTAILDLPASSLTATTTTGDASATAAADVADQNAGAVSPMVRFDPRDHLAVRYVSQPDEQSDEDAALVDDCTDFIEALCPDGSSLLEMLPLTRSPQRQTVSSTFPAKFAKRSESLEEMSTSLPRGDATREPSRNELHVSPNQPHQLATLQIVHVDAPVLFSTTESLNDFSDPETPLIQLQRPQHDPEIFVSAGSSSVPTPRSSRHRHATPSARHSPASYQHTCRTVRSVSSERMSSQGRSSSATPSVISSITTSPATSALRSPFIVLETCDVAGRILLTDRLVQSQAHTALPTVMKAYQQYLEASAAASAASASAFSESSHKHSRQRYHSSNVLSSKEQFDSAQQRLAPRQRGIVLQCSNTDPEVMKCVAKAVSCQRPSFRQIDPADRYGSSCYISGDFLKKN